MPAKRRYTLSRSPVLRAKMWDVKMDSQTYSTYLSATKPLALPKITEYQAVHENLITIVKSILERAGKAHETHQYMWYASKLYKHFTTYTGEALSKEVAITFLEYLARGLDEGMLRAIALALGIKISALTDIFEKYLAPLLIKVIAQGTLMANGTEQTLLEYSGNIAMISGYIDLSNMEYGDAIIISTYTKLKPDAEYKLYRAEEYFGEQKEPALYMLPRLSGIAMKVTLKQTSGVYKSFDYFFTRSL